MNKEKMLRLADVLENIQEQQFEMDSWISHKVEAVSSTGRQYWIKDPQYSMFDGKQLEPLDCGTACCIAGWATAIENNFQPIELNMNGLSIEERAKYWLELTDDEARNLFFIDPRTVWTYYIEELGYEFDPYDESFSGITNKDAAYVLKEIANGEFDISKPLEMWYSRQHLDLLGYYQGTKDDY